MDVLFGRSPNPAADLAMSSQFARKALSIDDSNVLALSLVSRNDLLQGRIDQAIVDAKRIIALDPNSVMGHLNLAIALNVDGRPQEAIPAIEKAIRLDPTGDIYRNVLGLAVLGHL
jgi:predicted Zn-dependent protease